MNSDPIPSSPTPASASASSAPAPAAADGDPRRKTNRLAHEKSPYLLQHQHNPVDWHPWGAEAFQKARDEGKPIFLSVGYSTCHWCHVMERESFENEAIAELLNAHFVPVKVDREERPDVDRVYMTFVQATTGSGGWPMSVFLTPDLKPFVGGTYFPPDDRWGRPGFSTVLRRIAEAWKNDRASIIEQGNRMLTALQEYTEASRGGGGDGGIGDRSGREDQSQANAPAAHTLVLGYEQIASNYDPEHGGFGDAPKFPRPVTLNFLLRFFARDPESRHGRHALEITLHTLRRMAAGGMHDHLGGGFHRYSVDRFWHIPHFEKMLYDQAQLALAYLDAFQITRDPLFERVARGILDYVRRDMTDPAGGFYSAEDADSLFAHGRPEHGEGAFYIWKKEEIDRVLGAEAATIFNRFYGVEADGNAPADSDPHGEFRGRNTLIQRHTIDEVARIHGGTPEATERSLADSRRRLFEARAKRPRPHLDDKIITAWNGLMISAFARACQVLGDEAYLAAATRAARFLRTELFRSSGEGGENELALLRSYREGPGRVPAFADDYAALIQGLLDLYEAGFDIEWLKWAAELQRKQDALFVDGTAGGYFSGSGHDPTILLRMKEDYDGAEPSPNSLAALNLLRLASMLDDETLRARADRTVRVFSEQLRRLPSAMPQMLVALDFMLEKSRQIVFAGQPDAADTRALVRALHAYFIPAKIVLLADGGAGQEWLGKELDFLRSVTPLESKAAAYVCEDYTCRLPVTDPEELRKILTATKR